MKTSKLTNSSDDHILYKDVCTIIDNARYRVAVYANSEVCLMNWHVGKRIKEDVMGNERAEYGKQVVKTLASKLINQYGSGWGLKKLQHCLRAAYTFTEDEIVYATRIQLSWTLRNSSGLLLLPKSIKTQRIAHVKTMRNNSNCVK